MRIAWYGRKSTYNDKSDSVDNQRKMCKDYAYATFGEDIESWDEYSDEDFTGANANRPGLQNLLRAVKLGMYDAIIVYQLDRLSRSVRDFSNIYADLENCGVQFISIKERIDTTTAIGRAMMYVTVVFAQMERETIATRIKDNMLGLAKKGLWGAGHAPMGYTKVRKEVNGRKHLVLEPDPEKAKYLNWLIDTFLSSDKSIVSLSHTFRDQGIKTQNGCFFDKSTIWRFLKSPYGVQDTPEVWDYFSSLGCQMLQPREAWDGTHGIIVHGHRKYSKASSTYTTPDKWIVCIGYHAPIVNAEKWLAVQARFKANTFDKTTKFEPPLLKGILKCRCGCLMGVAYRHRSYGTYSAYYCRKHTTKGREFCDCPSVRTADIDGSVIDILKSIAADKSLIYDYVKQDKPKVEDNSKSLEADIAKTQKQIQKLTEAISDAPDSSAVKYIMKEIEALDVSLQALQREKNMAMAAQTEAAQTARSIEQRADEIQKAMKSFDPFSLYEQNQVAKRVIKACVWDGEKLTIEL